MTRTGGVALGDTEIGGAATIGLMGVGGVSGDDGDDADIGAATLP